VFLKPFKFYICVCIYIYLLLFGCGRQQKGHAAALLPLPSLGWGRKCKENRQKLVGWDKGSLTEQQTKGTVTTTIPIRRIHNTNSRTNRAALATLTSLVVCSRAAFPPPSSPQPEPGMAAHGMEYPVLFGQVGSARPAVSPPGFLVKINPILAKPRTILYFHVYRCRLGKSSAPVMYKELCLALCRFLKCSGLLVIGVQFTNFS